MGVYFGAGTGVLRFDGTQKITGVPMTFSAWVFTAEGGASAGGRVVYLGSSSGDFQYFTMGLTNGLAGLANCRNTSGGLVNVLTTNLARQGAWNHIAATAAAAGASSVRVILNGDFSGAGVGAGENVAGIDRFSLGVTDRATPLAYWEGGLALVAGWNVVLPDTSIHALNAGADPRTIRPDALCYFYPLRFGPNENWIGPGALAYISGGAAPFADPPLTLFRRRGRASLGADVALTGLAGTAALGSPSVRIDTDHALTGLAATAGLGAPAVLIDSNIALGGLAATAGLGTIQAFAGDTVSLSGLAGTGALGTPTVQISSSVVLTGVQATGQLGAPTVITPGDTVVPTGLEAIAGLGSPTVVISPTWDDQDSTPETWTPQSSPTEAWTQQ